MNDNNKVEKMSADSVLKINRNDPGFWRDAWQQARLVLRLLRDSEVPFYLKLMPFLTLIYLISPIDLLPGGFDDATILLVGAKVFIELVPQHVVIKQLNRIRQADGYDPIDEGNIDTAVAKDIIIDGEATDWKKQK